MEFVKFFTSSDECVMKIDGKLWIIDGKFDEYG